MITCRPKPANPSNGLLQIEKQIFPVSLGRSGLTSSKREGDGATPLLRTRPLYGFYRSDRENKPHSALPFLPIKKSMGWCDAPWHPNYNRLIKRPFKDSHEDMWRDDSLYDLVVVLDINMSTRRQGMGSALFMHVARPGYRPTEGCIALTKRDLRRLLTHIDRNTRIHITR